MMNSDGDEFKLTLPLEFAYDGVEESILVRHMTSSHGHGSDRQAVRYEAAAQQPSPHRVSSSR